MTRTTRWVNGTWRTAPPVYSEGSDGVRHATWLELFFDLVFVVAVAELGSYLHEHLTLLDFLAFAGLFLIVWWVWLSYSYYADLFDTSDRVSQLSMIVAMFGVIFLSLTVEGALSGGSLAFGAGILVLRAILAGLYLRARHLEGDERRFVAYLSNSSVLTTCIIALSLLVPEPGRFGLWAAAVLINIGGVTALYTIMDVVVVQTSHLPERLGLMTIIVLGETILAISFGTAITTLRPSTLLVGGLGFLVAVALWWIYFQRFDEHLIDRLLQPEHEHWLPARQRGLAYTFSHYPVHMGIVATGVGITLALEASLTAHALTPWALNVLCFGVAIFLVGSIVCHQAYPRGIDRQEVVSRLGVAAVVSLYPFVGTSMAPIVVLVLVAGGLVALVVLQVALYPETSLVPDAEVDADVDVEM